MDFAQPECFVASNWQSGWVGALLLDVFHSMGLQDEHIEAMTQLNFSGATDPHNRSGVFFGGVSAFTRCVWEVQLGHADMCIGDFWETYERRSIATFTTAMLVDKFTIVTIPDPDSNTEVGIPRTFPVQSFFKIFEPFDAEVWALTVTMLIFGGLCMYFVEHDFDRRTDDDMSAASGHGQGLSGVFSSVYCCCVAFTRNEQQHAPKTWAGKLVLFGFHFFVYISAASYTATLASSLISSSVKVGVLSDFAGVQSWNSTIVAWTRKVCMLQAMSGLVIVNDNQKVLMDNYGPMLEKLESKHCGGAILGRGELITFMKGQNVDFLVCANASDPRGFQTCADGGPQSLISLGSCSCSSAGREPSQCPEDCPNYHKYCNVIQALEQSTFHASLNWALPVRYDLEGFVSSAIIQRRLDGSVNSYWQKELADRNPDRCNSNDDQSDQGISVL
eukprot:CAMPEP_0172168344 /NCGR_PEP_ID=MMETSP1050-20130122/10082_1 /TAXON_ID=233186 /ORGANISM="Cryptomonas curvata, Strain CCAP979/52" /LENGTH=445 /DNA_ID=CAMNT_0012839249 /DNA_START=284 /DNA_END=1621 /DNA_ORIENTATION=+